jgi:hypothetical protein
MKPACLCGTKSSKTNVDDELSNPMLRGMIVSEAQQNPWLADHLKSFCQMLERGL